VSPYSVSRRAATLPTPGRAVLTLRVRPLRLVLSYACAAASVYVAVVVQRSALSLLPWGPADLLTATVAAFGLYGGAVVGSTSGFAAGLVADASSDHTLGRLTVVLCVVGYCCGLLRAPGRRAPSQAALTVVVASAAVPPLFALTAVIVGDPRLTGTTIAERCLAGSAYAVALAIPVALWGRWLFRSPDRRFERAPAPRPPSVRS